RVGLSNLDAERKRTWELSGGQQQRVAIAAALAIDPSVLLVDNATGMLDPTGQRRVGDILDDLAGETALVVVDDDPDFVAERADRIATLADGEIVARGETDRLLRDGEIHDTDGVEPPTPLWVARRAGLDDEPVTSDEFVAAVDGTQPADRS
ncbi:MAG: ATP-binding cassette domain-containing protein, partial [Halobaculum sp.]